MFLDRPAMKTQLGRVVILVEDFDKAFDFYEKNFECRKLHDSVSEAGKRYLHIAFPGDIDCGIWFLKPESEEGEHVIGKQTAGQPTLVLYTEEIEKIYSTLIKNRVTIIEKLQLTPQSKFFHCLDLYGNRLTVVELRVDPTSTIRG